MSWITKEEADRLNPWGDQPNATPGHDPDHPAATTQPATPAPSPAPEQPTSRGDPPDDDGGDDSGGQPAGWPPDGRPPADNTPSSQPPRPDRVRPGTDDVPWTTKEEADRPIPWADEPDQPAALPEKSAPRSESDPDTGADAGATATAWVSPWGDDPELVRPTQTKDCEAEARAWALLGD